MRGLSLIPWNETPLSLGDDSISLRTKRDVRPRFDVCLETAYESAAIGIFQGNEQNPERLFRIFPLQIFLADGRELYTEYNEVVATSAKEKRAPECLIVA